MLGRPFILSAISGFLLVRNALAQNETEASQQSQWQEYDCFDPTAPSLVRRGQSTTVCLYVGPGGDWNSAIKYKRFSVNFVADEFSSYNVPGSFGAIAEKNYFQSEATHIFAASQSKLSFQRKYYDTSDSFLYPYLTAIIDVDQGIVQGIAWDNACIFCEEKHCLPNTYNFNGTLATQEQIGQPVNGCRVEQLTCLEMKGGDNDVCELTLYVVWTGTDADGNVLLSSDSRFSMFPPNRVQEKVTDGYNNAIDTLKKKAGQAKDSVEGALGLS